MASSKFYAISTASQKIYEHTVGDGDNWTEFSPQPTLSSGMDTTPFVLGDGTIVLASSSTQYSHFDPVSGLWTAKNGPVTGDYGNLAFANAGIVDQNTGKLYTVGNWSPGGDPRFVHIYDPTTDAWTAGGITSVSSTFCSCTLAICDSRLWIGYDSSLYSMELDLSDQTSHYSEISSSSGESVYWILSICSVNNILYVATAADSVGGGGKVFRRDGAGSWSGMANPLPIIPGRSMENPYVIWGNDTETSIKVWGRCGFTSGGFPNQDAICGWNGTAWQVKFANAQGARDTSIVNNRNQARTDFRIIGNEAWAFAPARPGWASRTLNGTSWSEVPVLSGISINGLAYHYVAPDPSAPTISDQNPFPDSIDVSKSAHILFKVIDTGGGPDPDQTKVIVGGTVVWLNDSAQSGWSGTRSTLAFGFQYELISPEPFGSYETISVLVNVADFDGNAADSLWSFRTINDEMIYIFPYGFAIVDTKENRFDSSQIKTSRGGNMAYRIGDVDLGSNLRVQYYREINYDDSRIEIIGWEDGGL